MSDEIAWAEIERLAAAAEAAGPGRTVAVSARRLGDGAAVTWNLNGGRLFPAASTIKVAVLAALYRAADAGALDPRERRVVDPADRVGGSGVLLGMSPLLALPLDDLAYLMIAVSDNTASNACIRAVGEERVRETMTALGMTRSRLERRFLGRLPTPAEGENWTTADDLVALLAAIAEDRAASPAACARMREVLTLQQYLDMLARRLPDGVSFAGKSGWLPGLAHDCGLLSGPGGVLAAAILTEGFADPYEAHELAGAVGAALAEAVA
jgi:beta-lactamase class A